MIVGVAVVALYAIWLVVSTLYQLDVPLAVWIKKADAAALLPRWKFFAPNPSVADYRLFVRHRLADDTVGEWREVQLHREKTLTEAIWNPGRRRLKVIIDAMHRIRILVQNPDTTPMLIEASLSYLTLLQVAMAGSAAVDGPRETQFAVLQFSGLLRDSRPRLVFHSRFHPSSRSGEDAPPLLPLGGQSAPVLKSP